MVINLSLFPVILLHGSGIAKKKISNSPSNKQTRIRRNKARRMGHPPPSSVTSGHLPHSQVLPRDNTNSSSEDMSTDSYTEVYGGRYSLDSASPQDVPSAPPIPGSYTEIKQEKEHSPSSKLDRVDSHEFSAYSNAEKNTPVVDMKPSHKQETLNSSRSVLYFGTMCPLCLVYSPKYIICKLLLYNIHFQFEIRRVRCIAKKITFLCE